MSEPTDRRPTHGMVTYPDGFVYLYRLGCQTAAEIPMHPIELALVEQGRQLAQANDQIAVLKAALMLFAGAYNPDGPMPTNGHNFRRAAEAMMKEKTDDAGRTT